MSLQTFGFKAETRIKRRSGEIISDSDKELLRLMADGLKIEEIADLLFLSTDAITTRKYRLYERMGVRNGIQAVAWAIRNKVID